MGSRVCPQGGFHASLVDSSHDSHTRLSDEHDPAPCRNRGMVGTDNSFGSFSTRPVVPEKPEFDEGRNHNSSRAM